MFRKKFAQIVFLSGHVEIRFKNTYENVFAQSPERFMEIYFSKQKFWLAMSL